MIYTPHLFFAILFFAVATSGGFHLALVVRGGTRSLWFVAISVLLVASGLTGGVTSTLMVVLEERARIGCW